MNRLGAYTPPTKPLCLHRLVDAIFTSTSSSNNSGGYGSLYALPSAFKIEFTLSNPWYVTCAQNTISVTNCPYGNKNNL